MEQVLVEDDGKGFEPEKNKEGIGIMNIESRAENIDGEIDIESLHGKGTTV